MGTNKEQPNLGQEKPKEWPQIAAILISCLSSLTAGMLFAWCSPSILKLINDKDNYDITEEEASYLPVIPPIAMILSSLAFVTMSDQIGRKGTILLLAIPQGVSWLLIAVSRSIYVLYIARFLQGIADACLFASVPVYVGEISTPKVRGSWGNAMTFSIYLGGFLINVIGSYCSIPTTAWISLSVPIVLLIIFPFMPESPYYYLMKGKPEKAKSSLQKLRGISNVEDELLKLSLDVKRQMSERGTWHDLLTIQSNRKAIYAGIFLRASQQLGGVSCFSVYNQYIFSKSGGDLSPEISSIIYSGLSCALNVCAGFTLDKLGRKKSYLFSILICGFCLMTEAIYFYLDEFTMIDVTHFNWIPITGMIAFVVSYSFGVGIVPTLMLGELFSASIKGKGLCLMNIIFGILVCVTTKLFHLLVSNVGLYSPFLFLGICSFVSTILSLWFVPETKGKTLEEIQQSLKGNRPTLKGNTPKKSTES